MILSLSFIPEMYFQEGIVVSVVIKCRNRSRHNSIHRLLDNEAEPLASSQEALPAIELKQETPEKPFFSSAFYYHHYELFYTYFYCKSLELQIPLFS